jgi:hypothetical protein
MVFRKKARKHDCKRKAQQRKYNRALRMKSLIELAHAAISEMVEDYKGTFCNSLQISKFVMRLFKEMFTLYHDEHIKMFENKLPSMIESVISKQSKLKKMVLDCEKSANIFQKSEREYYHNVEKSNRKKRKVMD